MSLTSIDTDGDTRFEILDNINKDENGNRLEFGPGEGGELVNKRWYIGNEYLLKGNEKKIKVMPVSYIADDEETIYEDGIVEIDLK